MIPRTTESLESGVPLLQKWEPIHTIRAILLSSVLLFYLKLSPGREFVPIVLYIQYGTMFLLCAWWAWKVYRREGLARSPLALPAAAFAMVSVVTTLFSLDQRISYASSLGLLTQVLLFFFVCDLLLTGWSSAVFVNALLLVGGLVVFEGLWVTAQWHWQWWELRVPEYPVFPMPFRLFGVLENPNILVALLNLVLPFAILRLGRAGSMVESVGWGFWLLAADVVLFFTRSRGGWVAATVEVVICVGWLAWQTESVRGKDVVGRIAASWRLWAATAAYAGLFGLLYLVTVAASTSASSLAVDSHDPLSFANPASRLSIWTIAWQDFLSHPLVGSGPGTYPWVFVSQTATWSNGYVPPHAHNVFLQTLAEEGLLGMLAIVWGLMAAVWTLGRPLLQSVRTSVRAKSDAWEVDRQLLVGVVAALAGFFTHSQVDISAWLPANALVVIILLALGTHAAGALKAKPVSLAWWTAAVLVLPLLLLPVLWRQADAQKAFLSGALLAAQEDWAGAAQSLDRAVELDPALVIYHEQRGYAYGVLATPLFGEGDTAAASEALRSYRVALQRGPVRVTNLVNAAELAAQAGFSDEADRLLTSALPHDGGRPLPALLLADRYAAQGRIGEAESLFSSALASAPGLADTAGIRSSATGRAVASGLPPRGRSGSYPGSPADGLPSREQAGQTLRALSAVSLGSTDYRVWLDRATAHMALGQMPQVGYSFAAAQATGGAGTAIFALTSAYCYEAVGQPESAIKALERWTLPGFPQGGYSFLVYSRGSLPGELLPRLAMLERSADDLLVYRNLARLYAQQGRVDDAASMERNAGVLARLLEGDEHQ